MKSKRKARFKGIVSFLLVLTLTSSFVPMVIAGVPASDVIYSVADLKVTSSPVEEENNFTVQATYHAKITNYGWTSSVWHQCSGCGGAGAVPRYAMGVGGGKVNTVDLICGQSFEGRTWMCRDACDGKDYYDQNDFRGEVTHDTKNPWDGENSNNWDDGETHIWDKSSGEPCICTMAVQVGDKPANSGMVPCRGCEGKGSIYKGLADCGSCDSTNQKDCKNCGGTGEIKVFETCQECQGMGQVTEFLPCPQCGGSGGIYVTVQHDPIEPSSKVSTEVTIAIDGVFQEKKVITFDLATTQQNGYVWEKEGDVTVDWVINAGEGIGDKKVETTIDDGDESDERKEIIVKVEPACNLTVEFQPPNSNYRTGTEVISTFVVRNHNSTYGLDIKPKHKLTASFVAKDKSSGKVLATKTQGDIVIPKGVSNIVYFKWLVPADYAGGDVVVECKINSTYQQNKAGVNEDSMSDNVATATVKAEKYEIMETEDTKLVLATPSTFNRNLSPPRNSGATLTNASWEQWEWKNDGYAVGKYSCAIANKATVKPEKQGGWQKLDGSKWATRSGYGINVKVTAGDRQSALDSMITDVQHCVALVPEFNYKLGQYHAKSLSVITKGKSNVLFELPGDKIHYTPIWYPNGKYEPSFFAYDYWSPAGMLSGYTTDYIHINGDMYDDWNSNRR